MAMTQCRFFSGYKPCGRSQTCNSECESLDIPKSYILIVHLGALGAVVRSTSLLKAIKRKFPQSHLTWVTDAPAHHLLKNHPVLDRVLTTSESDLLQLKSLQFDVGFMIDKSLKAGGVLRSTQVDLVYGFQVDSRSGAILPATPAAEELWSLGLDNHKKFFQNKKPETQLMIEALELGPYKRDDYWLPLTEAEQSQANLRRLEMLKNTGKKWILGLNTGCSPVIPYKKLTVPRHRDIILKVRQKFPEAQVVLLGGPEDTERNNEIAADFSDVLKTSTTSGLRDGLVSIAACDVIVSGDSLGMHMAISQKKQIVAWFGPTCAHEIDLYDRGVSLKAAAFCAPCWKRSCEKDKMCYDQVALEDILHAIESCRSNCLSRGSASLDSLA